MVRCMNVMFFVLDFFWFTYQYSNTYLILYVETVAKILRYHIGDTLGIILVLRELDNPELQSICDQAYKHLEERTSKHHIELHGAKQASMILRRMLKLHAIGVAIVGQEVQLSQSCFIGGKSALRVLYFLIFLF